MFNLQIIFNLMHQAVADAACREGDGSYPEQVQTGAQREALL